MILDQSTLLLTPIAYWDCIHTAFAHSNWKTDNLHTDTVQHQYNPFTVARYAETDQVMAHLKYPAHERIFCDAIGELTAK